jgi:hypothetical protein
VTSGVFVSNVGVVVGDGSTVSVGVIALVIVDLSVTFGNGVLITKVFVGVAVGSGSIEGRLIGVLTNLVEVVGVGVGTAVLIASISPGLITCTTASDVFGHTNDKYTKATSNRRQLYFFIPIFYTALQISSKNTIISP